MKKTLAILLINLFTNANFIFAQNNLSKAVVSINFYQNDSINLIKSGMITIYSIDTLNIDEIILYEITGRNQKKIYSNKNILFAKDYRITFDYINTKSKILKKKYSISLIKGNINYCYTSESFLDDPAFDNYFSAYLINNEMEIILK